MKLNLRLMSILLLIPALMLSGCITQPEENGNGQANETNQTEPDPCDGVVCPDTTETCGDGYEASCNNRCIDGACTTCVPDCSGHEPEKCIESWNCTDWSECKDNAATRTCTDSNDCGTTAARPAEFTTCGPDTPFHIIITDVYYDTIGDDSVQEWIEINNPTPGNITLDGYYLLDNSKENMAWYFPNGTVIQPNSPTVIARNAAGHDELFGCEPDFAGFKFQLNNEADFVGIYYDGELIDAVYWGGENGWNISTGTDKSIKRRVSNVDTDSVDDWVVESPPRPGSCFFSE